MSMSTHVYGFRPADEKWNQMKAVWDACKAAKTSIPDDVLDFFEGEDPRDKPGMEVKIDEAIEEFSTERGQGYIVDLSKLPKDVNFLRFVNSW